MSAINRLNNGGCIRVSSEAMRSRQTPDNSFGSQIRRGAATGLGAVAGAVGVAAPYVPGGSVVNATVERVANAMDLPGQAPGLNSSTGGSSTQSLLDQTKAMQEMQMSFNLQYLNLQNKMQNENRQFSTISNVLKTKHDTVKNCVGNIR